MKTSKSIRFAAIVAALVAADAWRGPSVTIGAAEWRPATSPFAPMLRLPAPRAVHSPHATDFQTSLDPYSVYAAPMPVQADDVPGGPMAAGNSGAGVSRDGSTIGCLFSLWDPEEGLWNLSYTAWLKNASGGTIASNNQNVYSKPAINGAVYAEGYEGSFSCDVDWSVNGTYLGSSHIEFSACADDRDNMIEEYRGGQVNWTPACGDFASSGGSANFTWSELNGGFSTGNPHSPWGIAKTELTDGLEATRTAYNRGGILLTSGYRCPHGNAAVGGVSQSLHMHGRAADMYSNDHSWTETEFNLLRDAADGTSPTELFFWTTYADHHLHAAW